MSVWKGLEQIVDQLVDGTWAEPVEFYPMSVSGLEDNPAIDPSRTILKTIGVFMMPGAAATGEGGAPAMAGFPAGIVSERAWISVTDDNIGDLSAWNNKTDRVYLPERDLWFSIQSILPSANGRPNVYIDRLNKDNP